MNKIKVRQGSNVQQILDACNLPAEIRSRARVFMDGLDVTDIQDFYCLEHDNLRVHVTPLGGGSGSQGSQKKSIISVVLTIVVAVVAWYVGAVLVGGGILGGLTSAAITMVGSMAIKALIPPSNLSTNDKNNDGTPMITGQSNQMKPYGLVPHIFGQVLFYPNLVTTPDVTNLVTYSGYKAVYDFGYGDVSVSNIKLNKDRTLSADVNITPTDW